MVNNIVANISRQIAEKYEPDEIILFGSRARGTGKADSDIDLCIIIKTKDKRSLAADIYLNVDSSLPFDVIVYTPEEWAEASSNQGTLARQILKEGVVLHGG